MNELLYSNFKHKEDKRTTLINWALALKLNECHKLISLLIKKPFNWDIEKCFTSAYSKNKPLLAHLLEIKDDDLIEFFFKQNPNYKIPLGYGLSNNATLNNLNLNTLKYIVDHTEDLSQRDTIELNWDNYKEQKFNYLISLVYYYNINENNTPQKYIELAKYLIKKGVDLNQIGNLVTKGEKSAAWITETTFLIECIETNFFEFFELGLQMGADPSIRVNANHDTLTLTTC